MTEEEAIKLIKKTLEQSFNGDDFFKLVKNMLGSAEVTGYEIARKSFADYIEKATCVLTYAVVPNSDNDRADVLIVHLKKSSSLMRARLMQRNFVSRHLKEKDRNAALVAFVDPGGKSWRFSFVKMEYRFVVGKVKEISSPARRYSFLVGEHEKSHTAQSRLLPILCKKENPRLEELEEVFDVEQVTKEFFDKYKDLLLRLEEGVRSIVKKDPQIADEFKAKNINTLDFAKKLLGQTVFLYFLQKKGWFGVQRGAKWGSGTQDFLRKLFEEHSSDSNFFNDILESLFYEALNGERTDDYYSKFECRIPFLNGGLFEPIHGYNWVDRDIPLPNRLFSNERRTSDGDTGDGILDVFDRYNFTVKEDEPLEKEVAIDPEMLGNVFERLLEVKDRKSKGTYYTPRDVVHYMCQESLADYLVSELKDEVHREVPTKEDIKQWVVGLCEPPQSLHPHQSIYDAAGIVNKKLEEIRVCDPAVGSGAFVVGMMHEIVRLRSELCQQDKSDTRTKEQLLYYLKRHAIEHCLYGVDCEGGAVEIARLRLWLSLMVDEQERETVQPLPNLDYKIVKGDALLSMKQLKLRMNEPSVNKDAIDNFLREKNSFFNEFSMSRKEKYREKITKLLSEISGEDKTFYMELYFAEVFHYKDGFDIVIANPPYRQLQKDDGKLSREYAPQHFETFAKTGDIYQLFYERAHTLLGPHGRACLITSNKWMRARYGQKLREFFVKNTQPLQLIDLGPDVFETPTVDTNILLYAKTPAGRDIQAATFYKADGKKLSAVRLSPLPVPKKDDPWLILSPAEAALQQKIAQVGTPLKDWDVSINYGIKTGYKEAFIIDTATKERLCHEDPASAEILKPVLKGRDIKRYRADWAGLWLIDTHNGYNDGYGKVPAIDIKQYPAVKTHLDKHWGKVENRLDQGNTPYNLRSCAYYPNFEKEKVIYPETTHRAVFFYDHNDHFFVEKTGFIMTGSRLKYVTGSLNSKLLEIVFKNFYAGCNLANTGYQYNKHALEKLPIPPVTDANRMLVEALEALVDEIHAAKSPTLKVDTRAAEAQIDRLVYRLYDLNSEEVALIEKKCLAPQKPSARTKN